MRTWQGLRTWLALSPAQRRALIGATWWLSRAYLVFHRSNVEFILNDMSKPVDPARSTTGSPTFNPYRAAWAVEVASRHVPWRADCLIKAIAVSHWIRRHGYRPRLHLGVRPPAAATGSIEAHAWLTLHDTVLIGASDGESEPFVPILRAREKD